MDTGAVRQHSDPSDWSFKPLQELDSLLRCPICFEYYRAAVVMPNCVHNYCSLCIRRYLIQKPQCPMCSASASDSQLKSAKLLDNLVAHFISSRTDFMQLTKARSKNGVRRQPSQGSATQASARGNTGSESVVSETEAGESEGGCRQGRGGCSVDSTPPLLVDDRLGEEEEMEEEEDDGEGEERSSDSDSSLIDLSFLCATPPPERTSALQQPSELVRMGGRGGLGGGCGGVAGEGSVRSCGSQRHESNSSSGITSADASACSRKPCERGVVTMPVTMKASSSPSLRGTVPCPVCERNIDERFINTHLDTCLSRSKTKTVDSPVPPVPLSLRTSRVGVAPSRKKLPHLVINIMKDRELKKKLKEYGLPTGGSRQVLVFRLQEYMLRYNAECFSAESRSAEQIACEVEAAEKAKYQSSSKVTTPQAPILSLRKDSSVEQIERERKRYAETHRDQFTKLIASMRTNKGTKKGPGKADRRGSGDAGCQDPGRRGSREAGRRRSGEDDKVLECVSVSAEGSESGWTAEEADDDLCQEILQKTPSTSHRVRRSRRLNFKQTCKKHNSAHTVFEGDLSSSEQEEGGVEKWENEDLDFLPTTPVGKSVKRPRHH